MAQFSVRNFEKKDFSLLGSLYKTVMDSGERVFWWVGDEENYSNVICAFEDQNMIAKGHVAIINIIPPGQPSESKHKIYINLKTVPEREDDFVLLSALYARLYERAIELKETLPSDYETLLCFGNYSSETKNNEFFVKEKNFQYMNSLFLMERNLHNPIGEVSLDPQFHFTPWKMETSDQEKLYLEIESEIWPDALLGSDRLREYKSHPKWTSLVVREGETIIGSLMAWEQDGIGIIEDVFVREPWRNQGIAKFLLSKGLKYLKDHNLDVSRLEVVTTNSSALSLYESVGFVKVNEEVRYFTKI